MAGVLAVGAAPPHRRASRRGPRQAFRSVADKSGQLFSGGSARLLGEDHEKTG